MRHVVLLITGCLLLAGCAAAPASAPSTPAPSTSEPAALTGTLTVFAAASLTDAFDEIAVEFEAGNPGVDVVLSYGGSSALATQIVEGAPADVFAAASTATMTTVADAGLAEAPQDFASNTLEIAVPVGNPAGVTGIDAFADPALALAICASEVPCGAVSQEVLEAAGVSATPDTLEQDVRAVLTRVELGEADAGLVYRTDVLAAGDGVEGIAFPQAADAVTVYPIAALADAPTPDAAVAFVEWVLSDRGAAVLDRYGFGAP